LTNKNSIIHQEVLKILAPKGTALTSRHPRGHCISGCLYLPKASKDFPLNFICLGKTNSRPILTPLGLCLQHCTFHTVNFAFIHINITELIK